MAAIEGQGRPTFLYLSYDDTVKMDLRMKDVVPVFEEAYRIIGTGAATTQYRVRLGVETVNCSSNDQAVEGADVVVMGTATRVPVINGAAVKPGCTVISNTPEELDRATVRKASKIVSTSGEDVQTHVPPWQAVCDLMQTGELPPDSMSCELTDVIAGRRPGRTSDDEIIVCLNPGFGVHDVAAASYVYRRARELWLGTELPV